MLERLVQSGMDCARLNFSHGAKEDHRRRFDLIREAAQRAGRPVAVLQDLQGPKIRTGFIAEPGIELSPGAELTLTTLPVTGTPERVSVTYSQLPEDVHPGARILVDDGLFELEVLGAAGTEVRTRVLTGGLLKSHKGLNLPGVAVSAPALTDKDREDLAFGLSLGVDYVALSFVRDPRDLELTRAAMAGNGRSVPLIAKLEKPEAVEKLEAIVDAADGIMVARGDLGVEIRPERVPLVQKRAIELVNARGKLVITATQMLDSMIVNPRPTRAEASDVANAVFDGTDAVMLSGETAAGAHPVEAVRMMASILCEVERSERYRRALTARLSQSAASFKNAIAMAAVAAAKDLGVQAIACFTRSGATAESLSEYRPTAEIAALTPSEATARRLALVWGVTPVILPLQPSTGAMIREVERVLVERGLSQLGHPVVITLGVPGGNDSNWLLLHRVGAPSGFEATAAGVGGP
jgi:pyruvate kinase